MNDSFRTLVGVALIGAAILLSREGQPGPAPTPPGPAPQPLALTVTFAGETARQDAAMLGAYFAELADELAWDGKREKPLLSAGVHFDALRTRAREARLRGVSIGDRQPAARQQIGDYLTATLGTSGGPVDAAGREKWVTAFKQVARACDAAR